MESTVPAPTSSDGWDMSGSRRRPTSGPTATTTPRWTPLPELEHQAATCLQVDNDGADIAGLSPVDLVELFQRGEAATLTGSNELSRTMANIVVVLIFGVFVAEGASAADWPLRLDRQLQRAVPAGLDRVPGLLLTMVGRAFSASPLVVRGSAPRLPALLLALVIPLAWLILQATSLGNAVLPVLFAFGILGRRMASGSAVADLPAAEAPAR